VSFDAARQVYLADGGEREVAAAALQAVMSRVLGVDQQCRFLVLRSPKNFPQQLAGGES
jgi:hypothetical protein